MSKYFFNRPTNKDILQELGLSIPITDITIRRPAYDEDGNVIASMEIDFGKHELSKADEAKLTALMKTQGLA